MHRIFLTLLLLLVSCSIIVYSSALSHASASFFEGKTIRIIVGYTAGGGFDTYARVISRHLGKHIPGNPSVIVENMPGAGSLICANHLYKVAKPDGLTIGHFNGGLVFSQVTGQPGVEFDARRFIFLGAATTEDSVCALTRASGITSIEKWMAAKEPVRLGTTAPGAFGTDNFIRMIKAVLGLPTKIISGYKGTADIRLAAESGEVDGTAWGWASMKVTWRKALDAGDVIPVIQGVPKPLPDLPKVPLAVSLVKTEEARQLIEVGLHIPAVIVKPFVLPPNTPKDRVDVLTRAFQRTLIDRDFLEEANKAKMDISPVSAEEMTRRFLDVFKLDPHLVAKLREILFK